MQDIEEMFEEEALAALAVQIYAADQDIPARIGDQVADVIRRVFPSRKVEITITPK